MNASDSTVDQTAVSVGLVWRETAVETTETAYSKLVAATGTATATADENAVNALATLPLVSRRRRRQSYGAVTESTTTTTTTTTTINGIRSLVAAAAFTTNDDDHDTDDDNSLVTDLLLADTTAAGDLSDNDDESALQFDSDIDDDDVDNEHDDDNNPVSPAVQDAIDSDYGDEPAMEDLSDQDCESNDAVNKTTQAPDRHQLFARDAAKENGAPNRTRATNDPNGLVVQDADSEPDDALETHQPSGRTKKTRRELVPATNAVENAKVADCEEGAPTDAREPFEEPSTENVEEPSNNKDKPISGDALNKPASDEPKPAADPPTLPDVESILASTDQLYLLVDDKETVTLKDIFGSLKAEYGFKLDKPTKAFVRQRLTDLISGKAQPMVDGTVSDVGDAESESEAEQEQEQSDYENDADDDDEGSVSQNKKKRQTNKTPVRRKKNADSKPRSSARRKRSSNTKKTSAVRIHADKLRKRRMEELRVRNEELMLDQSKEDQKRAEQIAAKFETNTDELKIQRLEQRLDLLQKLDRKRIAVMQEASRADAAAVVKKEEAPVVNKEEAVTAKPVRATAEEFFDSEESDSDDDMELEFVGKGKSKPRPFTFNKPNAAMSILDMADRASATKTRKDPKATDSTGHTRHTSPGSSLSARAALKNTLLAKQRKMGNMWLARELGYKTEAEHLKDCMEVENKKMHLMRIKEEERMQANERKLMRERLLTQGDDIAPEDNEDDEDYAPNVQDSGNQELPAGDDEDEEMQLAKAIEQEQADDDADDDAATASDGPALEDGDSPTSEAPDSVSLGGAQDNEEEEEDQLETQAPFDTLPRPEPSDSSNTETESQPLDVPGVKATSALISNEDTEPLSSATAALRTAETDMDGSADLQDSDDDAEFEMIDEAESNSKDEEPAEEKPKGPRNSAWKAMLKKDAEIAKKMKKRKNGLVEEEADEEEEEEVAGLEDFGFSLGKKKTDEDDEGDDELDEDDMDNVVDDISDNEGDEEEGERARRAQARKEEKDQHKEMIRRMRDGYDGRRGGIAGGGAGARGVHRFDQLVAADNREDAKRLGLLNDDEVDTDQEGDDKPDADEEEDEGVLLDKMLKDRFLHRSSVEAEEDFSDDEAEAENEGEKGGDAAVLDNQDDKEQDALAKRFAKRARMQRLMEAHGHEEEFSQNKLIDEDTVMKLELQKMKVRYLLFSFFDCNSW